MLRSLPETCALAGATTADDQLVVLRIHQAVQSLLAVAPEQAALVECALAVLADGSPSRRRARDHTARRSG